MNIRKWGGWLLLTLLVAVSFPLKTEAARTDHGHIYDGYGLFSYEERQDLEVMAEEYTDAYGLDLIVVTTGSTGQKTAMEYADDFYDSHGFGCDGETGVLLLVDMGERQIWISTAGEAVECFGEDSLDELEADIAQSLGQDAYYNGAALFLERSCEYFAAGPRREGIPFLLIIAALLISMVVSGAIVLAMYRGYTGAVSTNHRTYLQGNTCDVVRAGDMFLRTTTVVRRLDAPGNAPGPGGRSGGLGGGIHTSSGGHTHGGGGRHF